MFLLQFSLKDVASAVSVAYTVQYCRDSTDTCFLIQVLKIIMNLGKIAPYIAGGLGVLYSLHTLVTHKYYIVLCISYFVKKLIYHVMCYYLLILLYQYYILY